MKKKALLVATVLLSFTVAGLAHAKNEGNNGNNNGPTHNTNTNTAHGGNGGSAHATGGTGVGVGMGAMAKELLCANPEIARKAPKACGIDVTTATVTEHSIKHVIASTNKVCEYAAVIGDPYLARRNDCQ